MKKKKLYLDVCCYNRPFDDQTVDAIRLEAEAVIMILNHAQVGEYDIVGSEVIDFEIDVMENPLKKEKVKELSGTWKHHVKVGEEVIERSAAISELGFGAYDALHLGCAEKGQVDIFLTTDKRLLRSAERHSEKLAVLVSNPLLWLMRERAE